MHGEICIYRRAAAANAAFEQARAAAIAARRRGDSERGCMRQSIGEACLDELDDLCAAVRAGVTTLAEVH